ncbi:MAG: tetratricopeptide repeat protein [Gemmatimonadales bacterium]|nr:tetratricopeptide repeat protein [Gemmatimonadales bacterium]
MGSAFAVARSLETADASAAPRFSEAEVLEMDIQFFQARVARDSLAARDFAELSRLYLQRARGGGGDGDLRRAENHARRSLGLRAGRNGEAFQVLASSLMGQHRFTEARAVAERLTTLEPTYRPARAMLGDIQLELGDYEEARRTFGMLYTSRGDLAVAPRYARWEEIRGRTAEARRLLREARDEASGRHAMPAAHLAWFYWRLGDLALRQGRVREAEAELEAGLALQPDDHRLLDALARTAAARGRWGEAIAYGERAIARTLDPGTLGLLYQAYTASGDSVKAEEYYRAMSVTVLGQADTFHRLWGLFLLDRGREVSTVLARAESEIEVRRDVYGWDLLAWALYRAGRPAEAREKMRHALALGTRDASLFYHAGMIESALGRNAQARRYLETALEINPQWDPFQPAETKQVLARMAVGEE